MAAPDRPRSPLPRWARPPTKWWRSHELHLLVGVVVAALTVLFAAQRATDGARAVLDARLLAAGADADAALVAVEAEQLSAVRAIAFSHGVADDLQAQDGPALNRIVAPLHANSGVPMIDMLLPDGRVILAVRSQGAPAPVRSRKGLRALDLAFRRADGPRGGRLTEVVVFRSGATLLTISPVMKGTTPVGAVLAMTPLGNVLGRLSQEVGANLTAYDTIGRPLATTAPFTPLPTGEDTARALVASGAVVTRTIFGEREKLGRLIVDHTPNAVLGVALVDDSDHVGWVEALLVGVGLVCTVVILAAFWARVRLARQRR